MRENTNLASIFSLYALLWLQFSRRKKMMLIVVLLFMASSATLEIISLGAVLPFLAVLAEPQTALKNKYVGGIAQFMGVDNAQELVILFSAIFIAATFVAGVFRFALIWMQTNISNSIGSDISLGVYRSALSQPYSTHIARNSSDVIASISSKVSSVVHQSIFPALTLGTSLFVLIGILFVLYSVNPYITTATFFGFGIIYLGIMLFFKRRLAGDSEQISNYQTKVFKALNEGLGGIRDVLLNCLQDFYCKLYSESDFPLRRAQARVQLISIAPRFLIESLGMIFIAVIAVWMSLTSNDGLILPTLGLTALGAQKLLPTLQNIYSSLSLIMAGKKSLIDVLDYLAEENYSKVISSGKESISFEKSIAMEGISYQYHPDNAFVLSDVNLRINKGDIIGFVGETGGGKSTLINIVMALLEPSFGALTVDGVKISSFNSGAWQKHIGHVSQSIFLADSTIAENIAFGVPLNEIDMACVVDASKKACIHDFIESLPNGYLSNVGENGVRLSGGQRQRLGIARALYRHADIIVLDEATSALDYETEIEVMEAFENIGPQITQLIVAHRIQTLKKCTKIIQVNKGRIEHLGSYQEAVESGKMIGDAS